MKHCAAGFGSCCVFRDSCYGEVDQKVAYFTNPSFPLPDRSPNYCTYTIKVTDPDICQVRMDFLSFRISGPSLTNPTPPYGKCQNDRMAVFSRVPDLGLSEGNLICGDMSGQHIYVPGLLARIYHVFPPFHSIF